MNNLEGQARLDEIERCKEFLENEGFLVIDKGDISVEQLDEFIECGCASGCNTCLGLWL